MIGVVATFLLILVLKFFFLFTINPLFLRFLFLRIFGTFFLSFFC